MSEALTQKQQYTKYVEGLTTQVIAALPISVKDEDLKRARARFRVAFSADAQGALLDCTGDSIARAIVLSAMSGLFPGGPKPDVWLIPRKNKWKGGALEVNWQLSFRGFIRLARRAGWDLEPVLVFEGEEFRVEEGMEPRVHHVRNLDVEQTWDTLRYGYVRVIPPNGGRVKLAYLTKAQIQQRRAKAQDQGIWSEWPLEMALKTLCNYAGNREMFPLDDPSRYAIDASEQAELGSGSAAPLGTSLPEGDRPALSAQPITVDAPQSDDLPEPEGDYAPEEDRPPAARQAGTSEENGPSKSREELVEEIRELLKSRGLVGEARSEALIASFGSDWLKVVKMDAAALAVGLTTLRANLRAAELVREMAEQAGREPGED